MKRCLGDVVDCVLPAEKGVNVHPPLFLFGFFSHSPPFLPFVLPPISFPLIRIAIERSQATLAWCSSWTCPVLDSCAVLLSDLHLNVAGQQWFAWRARSLKTLGWHHRRIAAFKIRFEKGNEVLISLLLLRFFSIDTNFVLFLISLVSFVPRCFPRLNGVEPHRRIGMHYNHRIGRRTVAKAKRGFLKTYASSSCSMNSFSEFISSHA